MSSEREAVALLHEMVALPSLSGEEATLARFLVGWMEARGFQAGLDGAGNAIGIRDGGAHPLGLPMREIVLLGHMDTAPGFIPVRLEGDTLFGRGAVDAKGSLAAFMVAATNWVPLPGWRLVVAGAVEEESATSRGARFLLSRHQPRACIIGEPSGWDAVTLGYKGRVLAEYQRTQPAGHTAGPVPGVAEAAVAWWLAVQAHASRWNEGRERLFDQLLPSLRHIETSGDGLTDHVTATVGVRLPPDFDGVSYAAMLQALAGDGTVRCYGGETAFEGRRDTLLARAFLGAIRRANGRPRFKLKTGTADMNVVGPVWGCPIVAYGPGDSRLDHTPDEHLSLQEYLRASRILADVLGSFMALDAA